MHSVTPASVVSLYFKGEVGKKQDITFSHGSVLTRSRYSAVSNRFVLAFFVNFSYHCVSQSLRTSLDR
jgi:hypothetical protein